MADELALQDATNQTNELSGIVKDGIQIVFEKALEIGRILAEQKQVLSHGRFEAWIKDSLPFSERTARRYMKLHHNRRLLALTSTTLLSDAYKLLEASNEKKQKPAVEPTEPAADSSETVKESATDPAKDPTKLYDTPGNEVPDHLFEIFGRRGEIRTYIQTLNDILSEVKGFVDNRDELYRYVRVNPLVVEMGNVKRNLRFSLPYAVCAYCGGDDSQDCRACDGTGWVNETVWRATPDELKEKHA